MGNKTEHISEDVAAVGDIAIVPLILEIVCRTTGMGFAAVARVTEEKWVACEVRDEIQFGLLPGGGLKLDTTICHEIRQSGKSVVIDHVAKDEAYALHHTPAMYGFQSYISVPIVKQEGSFFGTLCAIDPRPTILNTPEIVSMFKLYAELISLHLNTREQSPTTEIKLLEERIAEELKIHLSAILNNIDTREPSSIAVDKRCIQFVSMIKDASQKLQTLIRNLKELVAVQLHNQRT